MTQDRQMSVTARLASKTPDQVNNSLASLARSCGIALSVRKDFRADYDRTGTFLGYRETGQIIASIDGGPDGIAAMRQRIEGAFRPAERGDLEAWVGELSLIAPRRNDGDGNAALLVSAYADRLAGYPADVAREALLGRVWRFWPSWAELHEICEELTAQRRAVRAALDRAAADAAEREHRARALPTEATATQTPEEAEATRKRRATLLGDMIAEMRAKAADERAEQDALAARAEANLVASRIKTAKSARS